MSILASSLQVWLPRFWPVVVVSLVSQTLVCLGPAIKSGDVLIGSPWDSSAPLPPATRTRPWSDQWVDARMMYYHRNSGRLALQTSTLIHERA